MMYLSRVGVDVFIMPAGDTRTNFSIMRLNLMANSVAM